MADPRNSWERMLPADSVQTPALDGGPLERLAAIERAGTSQHSVPAEIWSWYRQALADALAGKPAAEAFGFVAPTGRCDRTPHAQLVRAARQRAVSLLIPNTAENRNQAAEAVLAVVSGQTPPPSPEAAAALEELIRLRGELPKSKGGVMVIVAEIFKKP